MSMATDCRPGEGRGREEIQKHTLEHVFPAVQNLIISKTKSHFKNSSHLSDKEITLTVEFFQHGALNSALCFSKGLQQYKKE